MDQNLRNKSFYENQSYFSECPRNSNSHLYQEAETETRDAIEQVFCTSDFSLPSFGSAFSDKFTFYNFSPDPMHSIQEQMRGNHFNDTPLPENYSNNVSCTSTTISNFSEKSQERLDGCLLNVFSENTVDAEYTPMNVCIDGKTMSYDVAH
ncbi:hypothetical protein NPIL_29901, partial [Nephila pilipes]